MGLHSLLTEGKEDQQLCSGSLSSCLAVTPVAHIPLAKTDHLAKPSICRVGKGTTPQGSTAGFLAVDQDV